MGKTTDMDLAWSLVLHHGLTEAVFDAAPVTTLRLAAWLLTQDVEPAGIVAALNSGPEFGLAWLTAQKRDLQKLAQRMDRAVNRHLAQSAKAAKQFRKLGADKILAELAAYVLAEDDRERLRVVFAGVFALHAALRGAPGVHAAALSSLPREDQRAAFLAAVETLRWARAHVPAEVLADWQR